MGRCDDRSTLQSSESYPTSDRRRGSKPADKSREIRLNASNLTTAEKILVALFTERPQKGHVFTEADITVLAWKRFPETFGLRGYADQYPDSKHILSNIMGQKGLRGKRWISPLGATRYALTQSGLDYASGLLGSSANIGEQLQKSVGDDHLRVLRRLFDGTAYKFWVEGRAEELIFRDACSFWNITPASTGEELEDRLATIEHVLSSVKELLKNRVTLKILNNLSITIEDINSCSDLNGHLQTVFANDLSYIKRRETRHGVKRIVHDVR